MSKLTNRFIVLVAALALPACGSATTSSAPAEPTSAVAPAATAAPTTDERPTTVASSPAAVELSSAVDSTTPVDPDVDEAPDPGEDPADVVVVEELGEPGDPAAPTPVDPFVRVPFAVVPVPVPLNPVPPFLPVTLVADLEPDTPAAGGRTFTTATGCGSHCISNAHISAVGGSSLRYNLTVVLDVANQSEVEAFLAQAPIERNADGRPIPPFSQPTASGQASADWAPGVSHWDASFALEPATTYHLLVRARDAQGQSAVAGTFTTAEAMGPDTLATPSPCLDGCLEDIQVEASDDGRSLSIAVGATVDAEMEVQWARGSVVQTSDGPELDDPFTKTVSLDADNRLTTTIGALTPNGVYSFLVIATDGFGSSDRWVATVATPSPKIYAGIDRVHISGDGDPGSLNRGEISFAFGTGDTLWGFADEEKLSSNSIVRLGRDAGGALEADASGEYPWVAIVAGERDGTSLSNCFVEATEGGDWRRDDTISWCNNARTMSSQTHVPSMTLAEIEQLPTCASFDIVNTAADRCAWVHTSPNSSEQVSFDFIAWFDLDLLT